MVLSDSEVAKFGPSRWFGGLLVAIVAINWIMVAAMLRRPGHLLAFLVVVNAIALLTWPWRRAWRMYNERTRIGYDLVWSLADGNVTNRVERRDRRNANLNASELAVYQKLGGWGGPEFRVGHRDGDDPYPSWCDDFRIRRSHSFDPCEGLSLRITDRLGDRVTWSTDEFLHVLRDHGRQQLRNYMGRSRACIATYRMGNAELQSRVEDLRHQLSGMTSRRETAQGAAAEAAGRLYEAARFIDGTSRLKTQKEAGKLRALLTNWARAVEQRLS